MSHRRIASFAGALAMTAAVAVVQAGGATAQTAPAPTDPQQPEQVEEFFVVQAKKGSLVEKGDALTLKLEGVQRHALVFTDRPERLSGSITVKKLVKEWSTEGLDDDPPNAAITVLDGKGAGSATAVELTKPSLSDRTLSFGASRLQSLDAKPVAPEISDHVAGSTTEVPEQFGEASLFIDPVNDIMQYCFGRVINRTGSSIVGRGTNLPIPTSSPITIIPNDTIQTVSSMGPGGCFITYGFSTGARGWNFKMAAVTGVDNVSTCGGNCIRTVTHDTSTYRVDFEFR